MNGKDWIFRYPERRRELTLFLHKFGLYTNMPASPSYGEIITPEMERLNPNIQLFCVDYKKDDRFYIEG